MTMMEEMRLHKYAALDMAVNRAWNQGAMLTGVITAIVEWFPGNERFPPIIISSLFPLSCSLNWWCCSLNFSLRSTIVDLKAANATSVFNFPVQRWKLLQHSFRCATAKRRSDGTLPARRRRFYLQNIFQFLMKCIKTPRVPNEVLKAV